MGKTWRDRPSKRRDIENKKHERGDRRKMEPYSRAASAQSIRDDWN